jgi:hypothetical protein
MNCLTEKELSILKQYFIFDAIQKMCVKEKNKLKKEIKKIPITSNKDKGEI